ncbi:LTA synthase family protein [Pseudenterobacter timonensis]|uniref:LTA synthase family protein n=1 Tax=Pseudenterobacter timonensis TaxID=1755099 RepID=A0AAE4IUV9_9ENTR|nr:LTA synthase family protein [Pseudenterobacter timonensis]MDR9888881.1 LTA synthase family protein [Pseudenterobacter timonensis]
MQFYKIHCPSRYFPLFVILTLTFAIFSFSPVSFHKAMVFLGEIVLFFLGVLFFKRRVIRVSLWMVFCIIIGSQVSSIVSSGDYIIPLTLSNLSEFQAVGYKVVLQSLIIIMLYILFSLFIYKSDYKTSKRHFLLFFLLFVVIDGPVHHLTRTAYQYYKQISYKPNYNYPEIANKFLKFDFYKAQDLSRYFPNGAPKNIIILFTEGMSSKVIDSENERDLNVTPNIDSLYEEGLIFKNYFNHTAATFRGLRGQLNSSYQYRDGVDVKGEGFFQIDNATVSKNYINRLIALPEILNAYDYDSYFIAATAKHSNLNTLIGTMPFKKVYGMEDFNWHKDDRMSDKKIFTALKEIVSKQNSTPFFIGVYSSGTHHGMDSPDEKFNNGENIYYNKFYNYDYQLGHFIDWFKKSSYYKNTLLIITADHSTFPAPDFKKSFNTTSDYFVDTIPLIMVGAGVNHQIIDANGSNSLSLAPTILQILNINYGPNYFLGCSLFDNKCSSKYSHISVIGEHFYKILKEEDGKYQVTPADSQKDIIDFYNVSG